jgi:hypothetical protein
LNIAWNWLVLSKPKTNKGIKMETLELIAQTIATLILIGFWPFGFWYLHRKSMKSIDKRIEEYKNNNK